MDVLGLFVGDLTISPRNLPLKAGAIEAYHEFLHKAVDPEKIINFLTEREKEVIRVAYTSLGGHEFEPLP